MELKICCDASVKLEKMSNVMEVECNVGDYRVDGDTLTGDIIIRGNYIKDVLEVNHDFDELVPFTIVFNDKNYIVEGIHIQDFTCQEIINQGIECNFNILVNYITDVSKVEGPNMEEKEEIEVEKEETEVEKEVIEVEKEEIEEEKEELKEVMVVDKEKHENEIEVEDNEDIYEVNDDEIKNEIDKKYDNLLNEILEARADQNFLEKNDNIKVRSNEECTDCRGLLKSIPNDYVSYRVYYTNKESDIETIAKKERISVDKVYRDNKNNDIANKKRIIVK